MDITFKSEKKKIFPLRLKPKQISPLCLNNQTNVKASLPSKKHQQVCFLLLHRNKICSFHEVTVT
jgi:hypothetical protein